MLQDFIIVMLLRIMYSRTFIYPRVAIVHMSDKSARRK